MIKTEELKESIKRLAQSYQNILFVRDMSRNIARLLFLKYVADNNLCATTREDVIAYSKIHRMLASHDTDNCIKIIYDAIHCVDSAYGLNGLLADDANSYYCLLNEDADQKTKSGASKEKYDKAIDIVASMNLEEDMESPYEIGRIVASECVNILRAKDTYDQTYGPRSSTPKLCELASKIFKINGNDKFGDFASGMGISTYEITKDIAPEIFINDIDRDSLVISCMLFIMSGYKKINVMNSDIYKMSGAPTGLDSVFVDPPLLPFQKGNRDFIIEMVYNVHRSLNDNGLAVIAVPGKTLFQSHKDNASFREEFTMLGFIKAVISLPPMWSGTQIGTNLIVISRNPVWNPLFIDASNTDGLSREDVKNANGLTEEKINQIVDVINNPRDIDGFSHVSNSDEIQKNEFNWVPSTYISSSTEYESTSVHEIDNELAELYRQLGIRG